MHQEVGEHLKDFAPEPDRCPRVLQLLALGIEDIVAKDVTHRPTVLVTLALILPQGIPWAAAPQGSHTPSPEARMAPIISHHTLKMPPKCPESVMFSRLVGRTFLPCML